MKANITKIIVGDRIRKDGGDVNAFAEDIRKNGLINPISVMRVEGGELKLLAGFRRLKAAELLGWDEVEINILSPAGAEAALLLEISENEQRKSFTFSEQMDFAKLLKEIEQEKALERKSAGGKGGLKEDVPHGSPLEKGKSRSIIGTKIGMSGTQYERAKYIAKNASQ
ncbi:MAG: ParB N-terminal domain-containing protein, partial [Dehalococcoidia bacterium]|nr:ParB N-terminal domain-containing protein [Dehalococcoidia bacterium]